MDDQVDSNNTVSEKVDDHIPVLLVIVGEINRHPFKRPLVALLDSGSTSSWINERVVGNVAATATRRTVSNTLMGRLESSTKVSLTQAILPDLSQSKRINRIDAYVFQQRIRYDIILGRQLMQQLGIVIDFKQQQIQWDEDTTSMLTLQELQVLGRRPQQLRTNLMDRFLLAQSDAEEDLHTTTAIEAARYAPANLDEVMAKQTHLTKDQQ